MENNRSNYHDEIINSIKSNIDQNSWIYSKTRSLIRLIIYLGFIYLIYNYIPRTYLLHTSPYYQSMHIQHNVFQLVATNCKKSVMTLISYIIIRYTILKISKLYPKQKKESFQATSFWFYSKTRQIGGFIPYLVY